MANSFLQYASAAGSFVKRFVSPDAPGEIPIPLSAAYALSSREALSSLLPYKDFDEDNDLVIMDDGINLSVGFMMLISPLMVAGVDAETQFEAVINACPADTILQFGRLSTPQIKGFLEKWCNARLEKNTNELLIQVANRRKDYMLECAKGPSLIPGSSLHPRMHQWMLSVRVPFKGMYSDKAELKGFIKSMKDLKATIAGALKGTYVDSVVMSKEDCRFILRELLNPHIEPFERVSNQVNEVPFNQGLIEKNTRITVEQNGTLGFYNGEGTKPEVTVTALTVDSFPRQVYLPTMANTLGDPSSWDERITVPYFAYTTIHVLDAEKAKDSLVAKKAALNKQTMSESQWFRSMMGHLYDRRDMTEALDAETRKGHRLVRVYCGMNLYCNPNEFRAQTEHVKSIWRKSGFRISEEKYITLPVFLASLPLSYNPTMDPPNKGLQRASLMSSLNAASLIHIQGDWKGTSPLKGGPLCVSRQGQIASFDLFQSNTNYNFIVVAASGSGKSFLTNEIVADFLSKGGIARLIDVGRSYYRICEIMGGQNMVFSPDNPVSLNPFSGLTSQIDLDEMMPMIKDLLRQMAYPLTPEEETPAWQYAAIEESVINAWKKNGAGTDLSHVYSELMELQDPRAKDVAFQLRPFAQGRYSKWFLGERGISFNNPLVVVELEELKQDPQLQALVLTLVIHQITKEMYLSERSIPKLMAVDEAWDLLSGMRTGRFIETTFRRARKYNGVAGIITQSFEDFEKSSAAKAALENAEWQFILHQRAESIEYAAANKRIVSDEQTLNLIRSVKSGIGFSEIFIRSGSGSGLYRFVTDRHTYYTYTSNAKDIVKIENLRKNGHSLVDAIDILAREDYEKMWVNR